MGRFDDAAPSAEHGPKGARKNSKFEEEQTCFDGGQMQSGFEFAGRDGHASRVLDYPQESARLGTSKED